jgi:hypothetical protein
VREILRERLATVLASVEAGRASLASLPNLKILDDNGHEISNHNAQHIGFVGVALTKEIGEKLIRTIIIPPGKTRPSKSSDSTNMENFMRMIAAMKDEG